MGSNVKINKVEKAVPLDWLEWKSTHPNSPFFHYLIDNAIATNNYALVGGIFLMAWIDPTKIDYKNNLII